MSLVFTLIILYVLMPMYQLVKWGKTNHVYKWADVLTLLVYIFVAGFALFVISAYVRSNQ